MNIFDLYMPGQRPAERHDLLTIRQQIKQHAFELERQGFVVADAMRMIRATMGRKCPGLPLAFVNAEVSMVYAVAGAERAMNPPRRPVLFDLDMTGVPIVVDYPFVRNKVVIICYDPDGAETRAARLARFVGGRWTRRARGYVTTLAKAIRMESLWIEGWDVARETGELIQRKRRMQSPSTGADPAR